MNIHEYQGKEIFRRFGIPVPKGNPAFTVEEAVREGMKVSASGPWVVKAQIHAGGRGKAGGVKIAKTQSELKAFATSILGMTLVTPQTGPEGKVVRRLLIEEGAKIQKEFYLAATLDRAKSRVALIASSAGGMDIEEVAHKSPEKISKEWIDPLAGLRDFQIRRLAGVLGLTGPAANQLADITRKLAKLFIEGDCSLVEINPLVLTADNKLIALDSKINFDENAAFRHPDWEALADENEENESELQAKKFGLSYISLDGTIGCMVNGAGLAMATMDIIKLEGGSPANFLDVGGGATEERVREAFKIILKDPQVKAILVNIFGGIMKCDVIAAGIIGAAKELKLTVPLVVRLEGTNVDLGKKLLANSGLSIIAVTGMQDAARKAVEAATPTKAARAAGGAR